MPRPGEQADEHHRAKKEPLEAVGRCTVTPTTLPTLATNLQGGASIPTILRANETVAVVRELQWLTTRTAVQLVEAEEG
jgi:hypothetical protein